MPSRRTTLLLAAYHGLLLFTTPSAAAAAAPDRLLLRPRQAPAPTPAPTTTPSAARAGPPASDVTAITSCSMRDSQLLCLAAGTEVRVQTTPSQTTALPAEFTGCHHHGADMYCIGPDGEDVEVEPASHGDDHDHDHDNHHHHHDDGDAAAGDGHRHCHFHAGIEHCVGGSSSSAEATQPQCTGARRDYNVGLRVGLLFAILATSALGVFGPILLQSLVPRRLGLAFIVLKQFGTGIIISTAFVHLYTHASLMFGNKCLGDLGYEATTSAVLIAGLVLSFIVEYAGQRIVLAKTRAAPAHKAADALLSTEVVSILVMEAGILFHSLLIGLTLVVAGDSFFLTLFVVILFHQVFEGLALGTRIATIGTTDLPDPHHDAATASRPPGRHDKALASVSASPPVSASPSADADALPRAGPGGLSMKKKLSLAALFAFVTPIGMAIGIGVLRQFNGNDRSTLIAIGTLDALSAGILVWVGVVEMWAADWMTGAGGHGHKAELADANLLTVVLAGFGLLAGMALMSLLGKWA